MSKRFNMSKLFCWGKKEGKKNKSINWNFHSSTLGMGRSRREGLQRGMRNFWGEGYIHNLPCDYSFNYKCEVVCWNITYTSIKLSLKQRKQEELAQLFSCLYPSPFAATRDKIYFSILWIWGGLWNVLEVMGLLVLGPGLKRLAHSPLA